MSLKIGTLGDRVANRLVRHFPRRTLEVLPRTPIVSFSFDDAPESAWRNGADILERHGARGTYYVCGGLADKQGESGRLIGAAGCTDLAARGHELASHTFSHRKLAAYTRRALVDDLDRNDAYLAQFDGRTTPRNFALPFTMASPAAQPLLRQRFRTSRGGQTGINRGLIDPYYLSTLELRPDTSLASVNAVYDALAVDAGWLVVFTHDVADDPSPYGYSGTALDAVVREAVQRGFTIATVDGAMDILGGASPTAL
ncbi:MAG TPA: polysaccharide deacetylase family protein [Pelagibacterium sp.]|uniref:polysaccharide deacetylase family protein n=1 Tax=Pelagibacterium sp. TaxID=1967288 RepID=UPI002BB249BC|nr:polysaccharide deacetylase family protein [Pelagibacterium sp.]HWJ87743.1 polysaccharide deacetylase family protein [Pelagibacterium sp.]